VVGEPGREASIVRDVSLSVGAAETLCLVGESGCGKSVTARAAMRLLSSPLRLASGSRILLEGRDLSALTEEALCTIRGRDIAMIFQDPMSALNPVWTIGDQVAEGLHLHRRASRSAARSRAVALLRQVGIPSPERRAGQYPHELSGGMQQRAMIAMALACEPKVLIADEPTTALDATIQAQILDLLRVEQARYGMALVLITHDFSIVAEMGTHVAVMYAGRIVESGRVRDVLRAPQHPFTRALMTSIPRLGMPRGRRLDVIGGNVPNPLEPTPGCSFRPRCPQAFEACEEVPPLLAAGAQRTACWLYARGSRAEAP